MNAVLRYRNLGVMDALMGLPPAWLGIDAYKWAYTSKVSDLAEVESGGEFTLLGTSDDGTERLYRHNESRTEVYVRLDDYDCGWRGTVPGYGPKSLSLALVLRDAVRGGPCNGYSGVRQEARDWFTRSPEFRNSVQLRRGHIVLVAPQDGPVPR